MSMEARQLSLFCWVVMGNEVSNWRAAIGHFNYKSDNFRKRLITKINVTDFYIFIEMMADLFHDFKQAVKIS